MAKRVVEQSDVVTDEDKILMDGVLGSLSAAISAIGDADSALHKFNARHPHDKFTDAICDINKADYELCYNYQMLKKLFASARKTMSINADTCITDDSEDDSNKKVEKKTENRADVKKPKTVKKKVVQ